MASTSSCAQTETNERGGRNLWPIDWAGAADLSLASSVRSSVAFPLRLLWSRQVARAALGGSQGYYNGSK